MRQLSHNGIILGEGQRNGTDTSPFQGRAHISKGRQTRFLKSGMEVTRERVVLPMNSLYSSPIIDFIYFFSSNYESDTHFLHIRSWS